MLVVFWNLVQIWSVCIFFLNLYKAILRICRSNISKKKKKNLNKYWTRVNDTHTKLFQLILKGIETKMDQWVESGIDTQIHWWKSKHSKNVDYRIWVFLYDWTFSEWNTGKCFLIWDMFHKLLCFNFCKMEGRGFTSPNRCEFKTNHQKKKKSRSSLYKIDGPQPCNTAGHLFHTHPLLFVLP